ncbi:MAG: DUF4179 domain-containing protein, partial [Oscillospiraceae bacterium]|nr:DUF4179 domain-containing protein [Oscillospiraceae bacterium]
MNRNDEYRQLLDALEDTPLKLDFTLERALARRKSRMKQKKRRAVLAPVSFLAALAAVFVLLVNVSPAFAYAAGRIPVLRELARFVALSPSLSAAVENKYVQLAGLEKTQDSVTARIEYLIVDQKQLNIFFTLSSDIYEGLTASPDISGADGSSLEGFSVVYSDPGETNDHLRKITVDFSKGTMPDTLMLTLRVHPSRFSENGETAPAPASDLEHDLFFGTDPAQPEVLTRIAFTLRFDPAYTAAGEILTPGREFTLDGQTFTLVSAEIYPTHMRFTLDDDESNTAWLKGLDFYVENARGERFESIANGITGYGREDGLMIETFMLESAFFSESARLTLHITGAAWLDKDMEKLRLDLASVRAETLPEGVALVSAEERDEGWLLKFTATEFEENHSYQVWDSHYYDAQGSRYDIMSMSAGFADATYSGDDSSGPPESVFDVTLPLKDYPYDEVWLCPVFSRRTTLNTPVSVP